MSALRIFFTLLAAAVGDTRPAAYYHGTPKAANNPSWMAALDDSLWLSDLSLPGTHDTLARFGGDAAQTQSMRLREQLESGVRAIDVRCSHVRNRCAIHHGIVDQHIDLEDVLKTLSRFLDPYRSETVLMLVRTGESPAEGNTRSWMETWRDHYVANYQALLWPQLERGVCLGGAASNPKLEDVRGKVVVLQGFDRGGCFGIPYPSSFIVQDMWELKSIWDLYAKWEAIKSQFEAADRGRPGRLAYYANFLSGSAGAPPFFVASGQVNSGTSAPRLSTGRVALKGQALWEDFPRLGCAGALCTVAFEGTNVLAARYLASPRQRRRVGLVMADFPGRDLVDAVIACNFAPPAPPERTPQLLQV